MEIEKSIADYQVIDFLIVTPSGEVSNFLVEDYEAIMVSMNKEELKAKLKL